jgi:hypothetical protein
MVMTENGTRDEREMARLISERTEPIEVAKGICPALFLERSGRVIGLVDVR